MPFSFTGALYVLTLVGLILLIPVAIIYIVWNRPNPETGNAAIDFSRARINRIFRGAGIVGVFTGILAWNIFPSDLVNVTAVPGLLAALGPFIAGAMYALVALIGESTWASPQGATRSASLAARGTIAAPDRPSAIALGAWTVLLAVILVIFGLIASPSGRALPHPGGLVAPPDADILTRGRLYGESGPFPGWAYGVPLLIGLAVLLAITLLAARQIARRPAVWGTGTDDDAHLRQLSATRLVRGVQLAIACTIAGVLWFAAAAAGNGGHWWAWPAAFLAAGVFGTALGVAFRKDEAR